MDPQRQHGRVPGPDTLGLIDRGSLDRGDLVLAKALADDIKATGERGIAENLLALARER
jgi:hypothetical protein